MGKPPGGICRINTGGPRDTGDFYGLLVHPQANIRFLFFLNAGPINFGTEKTRTALSTVQAELMTAIRFDGKEYTCLSNFNIE